MGRVQVLSGCITDECTASTPLSNIPILLYLNRYSNHETGNFVKLTTPGVAKHLNSRLQPQLCFQTQVCDSFY